MSRFLRSTFGRLFLTVLTIQLLLVAALLGGVSLAISDILADGEAALAQEFHDELRTLAQSKGTTGLIRTIKNRHQGSLRDAVLLIDVDGSRLAGDLASWPTDARLGTTRNVAMNRVNGPPGVFEIVTSRLPDGSRLLTGISTDNGQQTRAAFWDALPIALLIVLPLAVLASWLTVRFIDRRIARIGETASEVSLGNLARRVALDDTGDSFDQLGRTINIMLDRISSLVDELRFTTDSLAHDLRQPLSRLRMHLHRLRTSGEKAKHIAAIERESEIILQLLSTNIDISRAEAGQGTREFTHCDIWQIVNDIAELYQPLASDTGREIAVEGTAGLFASAHRELLSRSLVNLVENALVHGSGVIKLFAFREASGKMIVGVADQGDGIVEDKRELAMTRFGRLDISRSAPGAGLGLALARAAAKLHGGNLLMDSVGGWFRVFLTIETFLFHHSSGMGTQPPEVSFRPQPDPAIAGAFSTAPES